jgi:hypothetical protein
LLAAIPAVVIALLDLLSWSLWRFLDAFVVGGPVGLVIFRATMRVVGSALLLAAVTLVISPPARLGTRRRYAVFAVAVTCVAAAWSVLVNGAAGFWLGW